MENISKNAEANTVSAVHQLDPTKYVRITEKPGAKLKVLFVGLDNPSYAAPVDRLDRRLGHGGKL